MENPQSPDDPKAEIAEIADMPDGPNPSTPSDVAAVKDRNETRLLAIDGVEGVAIGRDRFGRDAIQIFVRDSSVKSRLPAEIGEFPVVIVVTGQIQPL